MTDSKVLDEAIDAGKMQRPPVCRDYDEDCSDISDKVRCWLYDPAKGRCPFLGEVTKI